MPRDTEPKLNELRGKCENGMLYRGGNDIGKTGNLVINFSRQAKNREFKKFNKNTRKHGQIWTRQGK